MRAPRRLHGHRHGRLHATRRAAALAALLAAAAVQAAPGPRGGLLPAGAGRTAGPPDDALRITASVPSSAPVAATDDQGRRVSLPAPARRALALAPHAVELAYAAGAGAYLAGAVRGSDFPPAARALPSIGTGTTLSLERAAALRPDLVIGWQPATALPAAQLEQALHAPVYYSDPRTLAAIPDAVQALGRLFGTEPTAAAAAQALRARIAALRAGAAGRPPVRVFIDAGRAPFYTLHGASIVSDAVRQCGGRNVFAAAPGLAPVVSLESVLAARPDAVLVGVEDAADLARSREAWARAGLSARVIGIDADMLYRPGPRLVDAAEQLCAALRP